MRGTEHQDVDEEERRTRSQSTFATEIDDEPMLTARIGLRPTVTLEFSEELVINGCVCGVTNGVSNTVSGPR